MNKEGIFAVHPVGVTILYDGVEHLRGEVELSYHECTEDEADVFSVYVKDDDGTEKWLCDCRDKTTAGMVALGLQVVHRLYKEGDTRKQSALALADKARALADSAVFLADIAEVLSCTK